MLCASRGWSSPRIVRLVLPICRTLFRMVCNLNLLKHSVWNVKLQAIFLTKIPEWMFAVRTVLNYLYNLSTKPLTQLWYAVVPICMNPSNFVNSLKSVDCNCALWWVVITEGQPKTAIHSCKKHFNCRVFQRYKVRPPCKSMCFW